MRSASASSTGREATSGWNLSSDEARYSSSPPRPAGTTERRAAAGPACILLIEDNPGDVGLVREALTEHGVECDLNVISDGEKAVRFFDDVDAAPRRCPDLVILDLNLPRRSGHDVLERVRASTVCGSVPVVVLTSSSAHKDRQEAAALGATRYVRKPLLLEDSIRLGGLFREMLSPRA
ncbi:MAG TPA: response regulator [Bryobacteraceae bacterium]|nr:response regulator [Bryobacteraceae bacterium]